MITTIRFDTNAITNETFDEYPIVQIQNFCFYSKVKILNPRAIIKYRYIPLYLARYGLYGTRHHLHGESAGEVEGLT
jgi:hypothetical protein